MRKKDDFDDEFAASNAFGSIMNALDLRAKFEARKPIFATGIVVAMVAVLGGVIWYSYPKESAQREVMNTPIVRADTITYRATPSEPGGMAIPYRESTVFNTLRGDERAETARVENLLPEAEQPVSRQELFAGLKVDEAAPETVSESVPGVSVDDEAAQTVDEMAEIAAANEAKIQQKTEEAVVAVAPVKPEAPVAPVKEEVAKEVAKDAAKIEPAVGVAKETKDAAKTASKGGYYVQLGSVRERAGAAGEWAKLQKSFSALTPLSMRVQEADLGAKGKFFRIQGGPITEAEAKKICDSVKAQKPGGCLVVKQ